MVDNINGGIHQFEIGKVDLENVWQKGKTYDAQNERLYINRASGSDCDYRTVDGNTDASAAAGKKAGKRNSL